VKIHKAEKVQSK